MTQITDSNWREHAACRGMDTRIFFPERGDNRREIALARQACSGCPVKQQCLDVALSFPEDDFGIFGGYTSTERRSVRKILKQNPGLKFFDIVGVETMEIKRTR